MRNPRPVTQQPVADDASFIDRVFLAARTQNGWSGRDVPESLLREIWELAKWGPTSANCSPMRIVFAKTRSARLRLSKLVNAGNVAKVLEAPVTAVIGYDLEFYEHLPRLFPHNPAARDWFAAPDKHEHAFLTAFRNGSLQGAYFMLAARTLGLDCGPISGFDADKVDAEFWTGTATRTNFICGLGYGDPAKLFPRHPRFDFHDVCEIR